MAAAAHLSLCGVLWRYARLLCLPVDAGRVKREMRHLSILRFSLCPEIVFCDPHLQYVVLLHHHRRMAHAFIQSLACLLAQAYLLAAADAADRGSERTSSSSSSSSSPPSSPPDSASSSSPSLLSPPPPSSGRAVFAASAALSLVSLCWALASFNKHIRRASLHRLTLTWIGVIVQFLWRLGTVSSRCLSLVLYASVYGAWVALFAVLHWICMLVWLLFQKESR